LNVSNVTYRLCTYRLIWYENIFIFVLFEWSVIVLLKVSFKVNNFLSLLFMLFVLTLLMLEYLLLLIIIIYYDNIIIKLNYFKFWFIIFIWIYIFNFHFNFVSLFTIILFGFIVDIFISLKILLVNQYVLANNLINTESLQLNTI
jgi:hypothetical protein